MLEYVDGWIAGTSPAMTRKASGMSISAKRASGDTANSYQTSLAALKARLQEVSDLNRANSVLNWDQATYMPPGGGAARGRQQALLSRLSHERFTDKATGHLLDQLAPAFADLDPESDDACLIRVTRRNYDRAVKIPTDLVAEWSAHGADCYQRWTVARPANDFAAVRDGLAISLDHARTWAAFFAPDEGPDVHWADPFVDFGDEGFTVARVRKLFTELRAELVPLLKQVAAHGIADDACLRLDYPEDEQLAFALDAAKAIGYDLDRGRMDKTAHPFMTRFSSGDIRITTRVNTRDLGDAFFSTLHEAGHALYEQGIAPELDGTPLGHGASFGLHESQSRLWENIVGRSRAYWEHMYPRLQRTFPDQLASVGLDTFHRAINKVQPSLIRTDADELTYNLHVMIRFDLELALLEGTLSVDDLPRAWAERYEADLGVVPPDHRDGVLQDVHWFSGGIGGAFQGYTIGNILSAQIYAAAQAALPDLEAHIARGDTAALLDWLRTNLYRHGAKLPPATLVQKATGHDMTIAPYVTYLQGKYATLHR